MWGLEEYLFSYPLHLHLFPAGKAGIMEGAELNKNTSQLIANGSPVIEGVGSSPLEHGRHRA